MGIGRVTLTSLHHALYKLITFLLASSADVDNIGLTGLAVTVLTRVDAIKSIFTLALIRIH